MSARRPRIEILTFEGCPNAETTRARIRAALQAEAMDADVVEVAVETVEAAQELRFLGSPSVRVNGHDVEASAERRTGYGLMCRTYREDSTIDGAPSAALIREAIRSGA